MISFPDLIGQESIKLEFNNIVKSLAFLQKVAGQKMIGRL
jgi:hypothetical protein